MLVVIEWDTSPNKKIEIMGCSRHWALVKSHSVNSECFLWSLKKQFKLKIMQTKSLLLATEVKPWTANHFLFGKLFNLSRVYLEYMYSTTCTINPILPCLEILMKGHKLSKSFWWGLVEWSSQFLWPLNDQTTVWKDKFGLHLKLSKGLTFSKMETCWT